MTQPTEHRVPLPGRNPLGTMIILGLLALGAWFYFGGGLQQGVANDQIKQYEMVKKSGSPVELCVQAMTVAAAFLQAHREDDYKHWKDVQAADCTRAGVPF